MDLSVTYTSNYAQVSAGGLMYMYLGALTMEDICFEGNSRSVTTNGTYAYAYSEFMLSLNSVRGTIANLRFADNADTAQSTYTTYGYSYSRALFSFSNSVIDVQGLEVVENQVTADANAGAACGYLYGYLANIDSGTYTLSDVTSSGNEMTLTGANVYTYGYGYNLGYAELAMERAAFLGDSIAANSTYQGVAYGELYLSSADLIADNLIVAGYEGSSDYGYAYGTIAAYASTLNITNAAITHNELDGYYASGILMMYYGLDSTFTKVSLDNNTVNAESTA